MLDQWYDDDSREEFDLREADFISHLVTLHIGAMAGNSFRDPTAAQRDELQSLARTTTCGIHDLYDLLDGTLIPTRSSDKHDAAELVKTGEILDDSETENHIAMLADYVDALDEYLIEMTSEW